VTIFNYNVLYKTFYRNMLFYAQKINYYDYEDILQEIRIYVFNNLYRFSVPKSSLKYYINILIITAYRKIIFDQRKQEVFENSFCTLCEDAGENINHNGYERLLKDIVSKLKDETLIVVFYSIVYNKEDKPYTKIAKRLNMKYQEFLGCVREIRTITYNVLNRIEDED